jgi:branched-chain amino acid transport system substrate-binding protein
MMKKWSLGAVAALTLLAGGTLSACGSSSAAPPSKGSSLGATITLGTSLSLTGPLGTFGTDQKAGYLQAIADVNGAGGIKIGGVRHKIKLAVLDNQSTPTTASQQVRDLVLKDGAVALLGAGTPPITVPEGLAADLLHVPYVTTNTPTGSFAVGNKSGWKYSWDIFFCEPEQATDIVKAVDRFPTNHKIALFTDNEPDGVVERPLYVKAAIAAGDQVVGNYSFPVGTTDFTSFITDAKAKGAQVLIGQMDPPDAVALMKQVKSFNFAAKMAIVAKAGDFVSWVQALGSIAEGSLLEAVWTPAWGYPGTAHIEATLGKKFTNLGDLGTATAAYAVADVVMKAIGKANSTNATKINQQIAATNLTTVYGQVKFAKDHTSVMGFTVDQWQGTRSIPVWPPVKGVHLEFPMKGLS